MSTTTSVEAAVAERYSAGAASREEALCCPVDYDPQYLKILPQEILERDYGCGDPSTHVRPGDTVLDLGSGAGKICYIASQIVGPKGRVVGVDMNDDMLALAEKHRGDLARAIGHDNVEFRKGRIQDLRLDVRRLEAYLAENPVQDLAGLSKLEEFRAALMRDHPLVADASVDVILSNCVLNLVDPGAKEQLFQEMHRVLRRGGRVAVSDIVADEDVPQHLQNDPELWSGCISGAFREDLFLKALERGGFYGIRIDKRDEEPWQVVEGIEFRALTVTAYKGKEGPCLERKQAVVYLGPWKKVEDDDGHILVRGERAAVCDKTYGILTSGPYEGHTVGIEPHQQVPLAEAEDFDCSRKAPRHPKETKGEDYDLTTQAASSACDPEGCC